MKPFVRLCIKCLIAGFLIVLLLAVSSPILADKGIENENYSAIATFRGFYREPEDSLDVLFLGTSNAYCAFSPNELERQTGLRSYNLASSQQSLLLSRYWLEEALRHQHPKAVVLETFYCFYKAGNEGSFHKALDWMDPSPVKVSAVRDLCRTIPDGNDSYQWYDFMLPSLRYHERWSQLEDSDLHWIGASRQDQEKGYCPREEKSGRAFVTIPEQGKAVDRTIPLNEGTRFAGEAPQTIPAFQREYMDKITELCREEGILLILVKTPSIEWTPAQHDALTEYAAQAAASGCRTEWIDFNMTDTFRETGYLFAEDNADTMHANTDGARKLTDAIGRKLREEGIACTERRNMVSLP